MTWTTPRTFVVGEVLTAAILNQHLRDNLLETAPAKSGTVGQFLTLLAANSVGWAAVNSLIRAGGDTTERSTTSTAAVDLSAATGLSIPATSPMLVMVAVRKSAGAALGANIGLKLNTTTVMAPVSVFSTTDRIERGLALFWIPPRVTNYLQASILHAISGADGTSQAVGYTGKGSADAPTGTITAVVVQGLVLSSLITLAVDEMAVYTLPA